MDDQGNDVEIQGLLSCGEAACASVHGANRLGANSLLDLVVFGRSCANTVVEEVKPNTTLPALPKDAGMESIEFVDHLLNKKGSTKTADSTENAKIDANACCGVPRWREYENG